MGLEEAVSELHAISPADGRYWESVQELSPFSSEKALIQQRLRVEVEYLLALEGPGITKFTEDERTALRKTYLELSDEHAQMSKDIETKGVPGINNGKKTDHDVKSLEFFLRHMFNDSSLKDRLEFFHFGLTSEDVNNLAYTSMLKGALDKSIVPALLKLNDKIADFAEQYAELPMPGRTHGQHAVPTTVGKEFAVFAERIAKRIGKLAAVELEGKLNGATGNYSSFYAAYPNVDWVSFSRRFVQFFGLKHNPTTTQIESHDSWVEVFGILKHINNILIGFNQDVWGYISDDYIMQKKEEGTVGSSTMPQKINPIRFENSEGNLQVANSLLTGFEDKFPKSRFQRDLSDSTVSRYIGAALASCLLAYKNTIRGLGRIEPNYGKLEEELDAHWEVLAEPIQQILRREGVSGAYDIMKNLTQGRKWTRADVERFAHEADLRDTVREEIRLLSPYNYIGIAPDLARNAVEDARQMALNIKEGP